MQDFLTATIEITAIAFISLMVIDFAQRLLNAFAATLPSIKTEAALPQTAIAPQIEPTSTLPDPWMLPAEETAIALSFQQPSVKQQLLLAPARVRVATLEWIESNLPPVQMFAVEMPCAIVTAKAKLRVEQPVVEIASKQQLINAGIRKCKKLASNLKIRRYNTMRLHELATLLEGKIALNDLVA